MDELEIFKELRKLQYRVVPVFDRKFQRFEVVVEPWNYDQNRAITRKQIKRTGFFFGKNDIVMSALKETKYAVKLREVQLKLINHLKHNRHEFNQK